MPKAKLEFNILVSFIKEGKKFIAYSPALDLSTCGNTLEQAKQRFREIVNIFFEETLRKGHLEEVLRNLGWVKKEAKWAPPVVVAQEYQTVSMAT